MEYLVYWKCSLPLCTVLFRAFLTCAVLYCALLCCAILCCAVLCCAVLCYAVLCCAVLFCAVLYCALLCCAILCCALLCCAVLYCIALYCIVCIVLCCAVLCCVPCVIPNSPLFCYHDSKAMLNENRNIVSSLLFFSYSYLSLLFLLQCFTNQSQMSLVLMDIWNFQNLTKNSSETGW